MLDIIPLQMLLAGQTAQVDQLLGAPDDVQRLQEMGLRPGTWVEMVRQDEACIIKLNSNTVCLRGANVFQVMVRPGADQ
ncbi:FeoA domain protein [Anatilimnocola aggregata]|uniref:FeoA domain protein n=1 Tax=Anatilimnocola aggregata TaxID=2528021 RepID=A0A517YLM5_9BACT|nr:FeoA family protein [Anatilimnocola aggregata]QDU31113.1 FeoA domain protein [Anatilimnocola aggregata]